MRPQLDGGRRPIKRVVGDRIEVTADIFRDGHGALDAIVLYREKGAEPWREAPLRPTGDDAWSGSFPVERTTTYEYTLEAWPDAFASWRSDVQKKRDAGQAIALDLLEGRVLVEEARLRASSGDRRTLEELASALEGAPDTETCADLLLAETTSALLRRVPERSRATRYVPALEAICDRRAARFAAWYEFFVRSQGTTPGVGGTFGDAAKRLPAIRAMGFDVVYLAPIHPIGHAFRKGRNNATPAAPDDPGSPWAIGNEHGGHMAVEPALGTLDDFDRFVAAARANDLEVALDYALQCSPDHPYLGTHPEWFTTRADGTIKYAENPPKKYEDIVNFNWDGPHAPALWAELRDIVLFWIDRGVSTFRVDNPHTKPFAFWAWMISDVRARHPQTIFLAEAFTRPKLMKELAKLGFTQSYTYFTWRNTKAELTAYVDELAHSEMREYYRPSFFANTPDILPPYLQSGGRQAFVVRLVLAATLSSLYGIYSGFELCENEALPGREEYADSEKYEIRVRDPHAAGNIIAEVTRINRIRRDNPALHDWRNVVFYRADDDDVIFYGKRHGDNILLVAVNLDPLRAHETTLWFPTGELGLGDDDPYDIEELLSGSAMAQWRGSPHGVRLDPLRNPAAIYRLRLA
ncbi:MAG: alpha-1,4-glucan--maltose-1-phosphate maltosyltransferase [Candidatus Eremiobacteraeota bacterium]|nr:alpha-1,4-glucan--maltose-1-phosphate maltosyltransferase [Candidatus Eremiobacteraeota bacterium]